MTLQNLTVSYFAVFAKILAPFAVKYPALLIS